MRAAKFLLANAFGVNCLAYPRWNSLSQAPIYRRYPSVRRGNGESGEMTAVKTIRQRTGPESTNFHFVAQTGARHPDDCAPRLTQKDPSPRLRSAPGEAAYQVSARGK